MTKQIITIHVECDVDPSTLLERALEFGEYVKDMTDEACIVDEDKTYVTDAAYAAYAAAHAAAGSAARNAATDHITTKILDAIEAEIEKA
jgi:hypothetical protein